MTVIYIIHKTVKYLLPQWAMFVIFSPLKPRPPDREGEMEETDTFSWVEKPVSSKIIVWIVTTSFIKLCTHSRTTNQHFIKHQRVVSRMKIVRNWLLFQSMALLIRLVEIIPSSLEVQALLPATKTVPG